MSLLDQHRFKTESGSRAFLIVASFSKIVELFFITSNIILQNYDTFAQMHKLIRVWLACSYMSYDNS